MIQLNDLCRRQTRESPFSYYEGSEEALLSLAELCLPHGRLGHKPGVRIVPVPVAGFHSGVVQATERTALSADWVRRREGEDAYIQVSALDSTKMPARAVDLVLYSHETLGDEASTQADWEVVSINARSTAGEEPATPLAMARNLLGKPGGTPASYTARQLGVAVLYWSRRVLFHAGEGRPTGALEGPQYPPLVAGLARPDRGDPYVLVTAEDFTFLPPPVSPEPPQPLGLARRHASAVNPDVDISGSPLALALAESIYYWSCRPLRQRLANDLE